MTDNFENIDELFRSKLVDTEISAPQGVLESIQGQLSSSASQQAIGQSFSGIFKKTLLLKTTAALSIIGLTYVAVIGFLGEAKDLNQTSPENKKVTEQNLKLNIATDSIRWDKISVQKSNSVICDFGPEIVESKPFEDNIQIIDETPLREEQKVNSTNAVVESPEIVKIEEETKMEIGEQEFGNSVISDVISDFKPNVFTPNGDGINDSFFVEINTREFLEVMVLNRAGMKVFGTTDKNRKWAGDHLGMPSEKGVYRVILKTKNKETHQQDVEVWVLNLIR